MKLTSKLTSVTTRMMPTMIPTNISELWQFELMKSRPVFFPHIATVQNKTNSICKAVLAPVVSTSALLEHTDSM
jgi:hypothetical protein